jgi:hypothetical protein
MEKGSMEEVRYTERIQSFEESIMVGSAGASNFPMAAAADLFRAIPMLERHVVNELRQALESPMKHERAALSQYMRTVQVLRRALQISVVLQTHSAR